MTLTLVLAGAAIAGWFAAAMLLGLYLGERGRRRDAQRREGVIRVDVPAPATVTSTAPGTTGVPATIAADFSEARENYIAEAVGEGFDAADAAADFDHMMTSLGSDSIGVAPRG